MKLFIVAAIAVVEFLVFGAVFAAPPPTVASTTDFTALETHMMVGVDSDVAHNISKLAAQSNRVLGDTYVYNNCRFNVFSKISHGAKPGQPAKEDVCNVMLPDSVLKYSCTMESEAGIEWTLMKADAEHPHPIQLNWLWRPGARKIGWNFKLGEEQKIPSFKWLNVTKHHEKRFWTNRYAGHDFEEHGLSVSPFFDSFPLKKDLCMPFGCIARTELCVWKYKRFFDWDKEKECAETTNFKILLCTEPSDDF
jgi:hypothetical protein